MTTVGAIINTRELWQTALAAAVGGIGVTLVFSLAVLGGARFIDASRDGRTLSAAIFGVLAVLGLGATAALIVIGLIVMTSK